jgi:hypothetical protein
MVWAGRKYNSLEYGRLEAFAAEPSRGEKTLVASVVACNRFQFRGERADATDDNF